MILNFVNDFFTIDAAGTSSAFTYDSMDRLTKIRVHRVDETHKVDEYQETLYTYDHRGLVKTEVNAKGDGKVFVYDGNGNLIQKTDEDGYVTEYEYSPVNLVSNINYNDAKSASYAYNGTGELIEMDDWNGKTSIGRDLLNRVVKVTDHNGREVEYGWDNTVGTLSHRVWNIARSNFNKKLRRMHGSFELCSRLLGFK